MDYSTGTALFKYQWDYVHDPQKVIPLFEGDEEGALVLTEDDIFCRAQVGAWLTAIREMNLNGREIAEFRWGEDVTCDIRKIPLDKLVLERVIFDLPFTSFGGDVQFNTRIYHKKPVSIFNGKIGNFLQYEFGDLEDETNPTIILKIIIDKLQEASFEEYLFSNKTGDNSSESCILEVRIVTTLIDENEKNTFSSFTIDNGAVTGYFIERDGKPENLQWIAEKSKRIPGNTYEVVRNDCKKYYDDLGKSRRANCANEFRLITTPEKSGTRSGILIHTGSHYVHSAGCLLTVENGYKVLEKEFDIGGTLKTLNIYNSNETTMQKLIEINSYISKRKWRLFGSEKNLTF